MARAHPAALAAPGRDPRFPVIPATMSNQNPLSDAELNRIETAIREGSLRDAEELDGWVGRMLAEVRAARSGRAASDPHKHHGDALLDHSGSRHGADARQP
jgi:hypothetical protein